MKLRTQEYFKPWCLISRRSEGFGHHGSRFRSIKHHGQVSLGPESLTCLLRSVATVRVAGHLGPVGVEESRCGGVPPGGAVTGTG